MLNAKWALHALDMVHCDLRGPALVLSNDGYRYYFIFINNFSRFTWFYHLKAKSSF